MFELRSSDRHKECLCAHSLFIFQYLCLCLRVTNVISHLFVFWDEVMDV